MAVAGTESTSLKCAQGTALKAVIDAGIIVIPGKAGVQIIVDGGWMRSTGTADTATSVDWTDGTTVVCAFTVAALTDGAIDRAGVATTSVGTNLGTPLAVGKPVKVKTTGAGIGTATAMEWCIVFHETRIT